MFSAQKIHSILVVFFWLSFPRNRLDWRQIQMHIDLFYQQFVIAPIEQWEKIHFKITASIKCQRQCSEVQMEEVNEGGGDDEDDKDGSGKHVRQFPIYSSNFK